MKLKSLTGKRKTGKGRIAAVLALAVLLSAAPAIKTEAELPDLENGKFSVTLNGPAASATEYNELGDAKVVVDVYKVASAKELEGYDAYEFDFTNSAFTEAEEKYKVLQEASEAAQGQPIEASLINDFAQYLEGFVFENPAIEKAATVPMKKDNATGVVSATVTMDGAPGMYLLIPRGSDLTDYQYKPENDPDYKATIANGPSKQYIFAPILVSVPNRGFDINAEENETFKIDGNDQWTYKVGDDNTANTDGGWESALDVNLKIGQKDLITKFSIVKDLTEYETLDGREDEGTFVFKIEAVDADNNLVFSDVRSLRLSDITSKSTVVENVPVGSKVTVSEVYAGGDYKCSGADIDEASKDKTEYSIDENYDVTFTAIPYETSEDSTQETMLTVTFENNYNDTWKDTGSVTNKMTPRADGGWNDPQQDYSHETPAPDNTQN